MQTERLNIVGLETAWGFKTIELYEGDPSGDDISFDLLVASAFMGGYNPRPGTLFGDLKINQGIDMRDEETAAEYDFRKPLGLWISREIQGHSFRRILVLEMIGMQWPIEECVKNAFAAVAALSANPTSRIRGGQGS